MIFLKKSGLIIVAAVIVITVATLVAIAAGESISDINLFTGSLIATLRPWRWLLLIAIVAFWPFSIDFLARKYSLDDERAEYGHSLRWRVALYLIVFEFIIVEAVPARLFGF